MRFAYRMPAEGRDWLRSPALLTDDEKSRLISVAIRLLGIISACPPCRIGAGGHRLTKERCA
jgi:hypothetical protein